MKKVLLTGGAGYIGNVITRRLLDGGYKVTCLDDLRYRQGNSILPLVTNPNYEFIFGDVRNEGLIKKLIDNVDIILPFAAIVGAPACDKKPHDAQTINYGAIKLIEMIRSKDQKIICPITNSGYGTKTGEVECTEDSPLEPISFYGQTKVDAEEVLLNGKGAITLRLATVFGISPRMRRDLMVNDFVYQAMTNGSIVLFEPNFRRNFIHVQDVASSFLHSIENYDKMVNNAFNVGIDSANMTKMQLAEKVKEYIPQFEIYESKNGSDPDKRDYIISNEKIRKQGFEAKIGLDSGIKELIKGYNILLKNIPDTNV